MRAILTTIGQDQVGIIAGVSKYLSDHEINILDVSQTIMGGNFTMMMLVDLPQTTDFQNLTAELSKLGTSLGVEINVRNEEIYRAMHQL
ncbi:MAG TPA: ACT domain-containing protein [Candidatus Ligilactobacillus excrementavium]|nr:ACT domain-containing protein [Candidatus Ligilactobacillus excrementavium]